MWRADEGETKPQARERLLREFTSQLDEHLEELIMPAVPDGPFDRAWREIFPANKRAFFWLVHVLIPRKPFGRRLKYEEVWKVDDPNDPPTTKKVRKKCELLAARLDLPLT